MRNSIKRSRGVEPRFFCGVGQLLDKAKHFDTNTAKTFTAVHEANIPINDYYLGFTRIHGAARSGKTFEQAVQLDDYTATLPSNIQKEAYNAGVKAGAIADDVSMQNALSVKVKKVTSKFNTVKQEIVKKFKQAVANGDIALMNKLRDIYKRLNNNYHKIIRNMTAKFGKAAGGVVKSGGEKVDVQKANPLVDAKTHTAKSIQKVIEDLGLDVNEFAELLDASRTLNDNEKAIVNKVLKKIGTPKKGTVMQKVIPISYVDGIVSGEYTSFENFVTQQEFVSCLNTFSEVCNGIMLIYPGSNFSPQDTMYARIKYEVDNEGSLSFATDPKLGEPPFTARGFVGTSKIIGPEYIQAIRKYEAGDIIEVVDSKTGEVIKTYVFDSEKHWILKGGK